MPRPLRRISSTGIYHVFFRGVNHCNLFEDQQDFAVFLKKLSRVQDALPFSLFAYCLMNNHVHLLIKENAPGEVISIMHDLLSGYAFWFNRKYQRSGALIANRYKSRCVEDDSYLLSLVRYIHQNPMIAGLVDDLADYPWSSYREYTARRKGLTETSFVLSLFADDTRMAIEEFQLFNLEHIEKNAIREDPSRLTVEQLHDELKRALDGREPHTLCRLDRQERDKVLSSLRTQGFSIRQIERATGVSRWIIAHA